METDIKGRLIITKEGCTQIMKISRDAFKNITRIGMPKVFSDIMTDLGGTKWYFEKVD